MQFIRRVRFGEQNFKGSNLWNQLPDDFKNLCTIDIFKHKLYVKHLCPAVWLKLLNVACLQVLSDCSAHSVIGSWHHNVACPSVCLAVCNAVHCGTRVQCRWPKVVPEWSVGPFHRPRPNPTHSQPNPRTTKMQ